jgi:hypothetical protein
MDIAGEILEYFRKQDRKWINSNGMELGLSGKNEIWTNFSQVSSGDGPLALSISTEDCTINDFIEGFNLKSIRDIDTLAYGSSWIRYLNGNAEIHVTPFDLDATITFRIFRAKTIVYSVELHFYDEEYNHLTLEEDFAHYIGAKAKLLDSAMQNRYKKKPRY